MAADQKSAARSWPGAAPSSAATPRRPSEPEKAPSRVRPSAWLR